HRAGQRRRLRARADDAAERRAGRAVRRGRRVAARASAQALQCRRRLQARRERGARGRIERSRTHPDTGGARGAGPTRRPGASRDRTSATQQRTRARPRRWRMGNLLRTNTMDMIKEGTQIARQEAEAAAHAGEYLTFKLGGEEYGIDILRVQEIR